jgi:predicted enzyme related to lactoylglutathione lyase
MTVTTPVIGSILVGSTDPGRLRSWYQAAFAPDQPEQGPLDVGGVLLVFDHRPELADKNPEPVRMMVNFHVEDAHQRVAHLNAIGVSWIAELESRPSGYFATLVDPDGNYVQIIEFVT